jgi:predicted acylesterase/phospholipase RssA
MCLQVTHDAQREPTVVKALILSGGGARGSYEAGVALALLEHEHFDVICGTSIGAINGALIAQGDRAQLESLWSTVASLKVVRLAPEIEAIARVVADLRQFSADALPRRASVLVQLAQDYAKVGSSTKLTHLLGALSSQPIVEYLGQHLNYESIAHTLVVSVTNLTKGRPEAFYYFTGPQSIEDAKSFAEREPFSHPLTNSNYLDAVRASAAIPAAFPPVVIDDKACRGCQYVDGGVTGNAPVSQAVHAGATDVTVIFMDRADLRPPNWQISSIADIAMVSQDIMQQRMLERDLRLAETINAAVMNNQAPGKRYLTIRTISPQTPIGLSVLDFDKQDRIDAAMAQGRHDAERVVAAGTRPS